MVMRGDEGGKYKAIRLGLSEQCSVGSDND